MTADDVVRGDGDAQAVLEVCRLIGADADVGVVQGLDHGRAVGDADQDEVGRTGIDRKIRHVL